MSSKTNISGHDGFTTKFYQICNVIILIFTNYSKNSKRKKYFLIHLIRPVLLISKSAKDVKSNKMSGQYLCG
jgi:hypothetical protein